MVDVILEAAAHVFDQHGYEGATTNRGAERVGVSVGSVYPYFPNKNVLLTALHERHHLQMQAVVDRALAAHGGTLKEVIGGVVTATLAVHRAEPRLQRILHMAYPFFERPVGAIHSARRLFERTRAVLEAHRAQLGRDDLDLATYRVLRMVEALVHLAVLDPPVAARGRARSGYHRGGGGLPPAPALSQAHIV